MFALRPLANRSGIYADMLPYGYQVQPVCGSHFLNDFGVVPLHCLPAFRQSPVVKHHRNSL
ncbi:hypothetical protein SORDD17_01656 [Streptococcus oralis]|uniref:Uncharacterized protein n=1 Tax=Streptococcus oralis TaxID=1303 RepID=A0A139RFW9_STROR|nr:hypothetical protein SORDD17_01656 [Streptococcus oralis]